jgi:N6-L-threonylcarbamoyladenine synthase
MPARRRPPCPLPEPPRPLLALGLEGSANKLGAGVVLHSPEGNLNNVEILSNVRHTYVTPPGEGFLPSETAKHHKQWIMSVVKQAMENAKVGFDQLDCICYTKGAVLFFFLVIILVSSCI